MTSIRIESRAALGLEPEFLVLGTTLAKQDGWYSKEISLDALYGYGLYMAGRVWAFQTNEESEWIDEHRLELHLRRRGLVDAMEGADLIRRGPGGRKRVAGSKKLSWLSEMRQTGRTNGKSGGRPKTLPITTPIPVKKRERFSPPTQGEISDYIAENSLEVDAEGFFLYYESVGWVVGRKPMKSWKSAARNWHRRNQTPSSQQKESPYREVGD